MSRRLLLTVRPSSRRPCAGEVCTSSPSVECSGLSTPYPCLIRPGWELPDLLAAAERVLAATGSAVAICPALRDSFCVVKGAGSGILDGRRCFWS